MEQVLARGVNFLYTKQFIIEKYGNKEWEQALQLLSAEAQKIWKEPVLPVHEHPFDLYKELISSLTGASNIKQFIELSSIYEYIADHSLNKLYKVFFSFAKPQFVTLKIYNANGQLLSLLKDGIQTSGAHSAVWDGMDESGTRVSAGVYIAS